MDKLGFLTRLLELWKEYGPLAQDLIPIIKRVVGEISSESGKDPRTVLSMAMVEKSELDRLLAEDLAGLTT